MTHRMFSPKDHFSMVTNLQTRFRNLLWWDNFSTQKRKTLNQLLQAVLSMLFIIFLLIYTFKLFPGSVNLYFYFLSLFVWKCRGYIHLFLIAYELLDNLPKGRNQPLWRAHAASWGVCSQPCLAHSLLRDQQLFR